MSEALDNTVSLLNDLKDLVHETNRKTLEEDPEPYFPRNVNFFNKSFMVILCTYLELYLKDVILFVITEMNQRLKESNLPYNLVKWSLNKDRESKPKDYDSVGNFVLELDKKEIDKEVSGDVGKTIAAFKKLGIFLEENSKFKKYKNEVGYIISKRNNIIHHGDNASDIAFRDVIANIESTLEYIRSIDAEVMKHL